MGWQAAGVYFLAFSLSRPAQPLTARLASSRTQYARASIHRIPYLGFDESEPASASIPSPTDLVLDGPGATSQTVAPEPGDCKLRQPASTSTNAAATFW
jgi:hypothetical protein